MAINPEELEAPEGVKLIDPTDPDPEPVLNEDQAILHGGEPQMADVRTQMQSVNARVMGSSIPVPVRVLRALPILRAAAQDPKLPTTVRDMYRTMVLSIDERARNGKA